MKKVLLMVYLLALCNLTLLAQTGKESLVGHITEKSAIGVASQDGSGGWQTIFSNVGPPSHPYLISKYSYWYVSGEQLVGMAFTPTCDAYVTEVRLALEHFKGAKQVNISIYRDINGLPGGLYDPPIEGPVLVTKIPAAGTKGGFTVADFLPVPVYKGERYWVTATAPYPGPGSTFVGDWYWVDQGTYPPVAFDLGTTWFEEPSFQQPAGIVLGWFVNEVIIGD